jgi:hypothetical protein
MGPFDELLRGVYSSTVAEVSILVRQVEVRIGVLRKPVTIRIYYTERADEPYRFAMSARMKTANKGGVREGQHTAASEGDALRRAVRLLTQDYEDAVRQGKMPDESWLVEGDDDE